MFCSVSETVAAFNILKTIFSNFQTRCVFFTPNTLILMFSPFWLSFRLRLRTGSALVGSLSAIAYATVFASLSHGTTGAKAAFIMALQQLWFWNKKGWKNVVFFYHCLIFNDGGCNRCIVSYESPFIVVDLDWSCCGSWPGKQENTAFLDQNVPRLIASGDEFVHHKMQVKLRTKILPENGPSV